MKNLTLLQIKKVKFYSLFILNKILLKTIFTNSFLTKKKKFQTPYYSHGTILFPLSPLSPQSTNSKYKTSANNPSRKKGFVELGSLININIIINNYFFYIIYRLRCYYMLLHNQSVIFVIYNKLFYIYIIMLLFT